MSNLDEASYFEHLQQLKNTDHQETMLINLRNDCKRNLEELEKQLKSKVGRNVRNHLVITGSGYILVRYESEDRISVTAFDFAGNQVSER